MRSAACRTCSSAAAPAWPRPWPPASTPRCGPGAPSSASSPSSTATTHHFTQRDVELLSGFVEPAALAIDNARWFARLRTVGADEERTRIARDLHDRIGQSLAYLAFELDRIVDSDEQGDALGPALDQLRNDVRGVIGEVRDTLYDLRTDVSDEQDLAAVLEAFADRVAERSGLVIEVHCDQDARLPLLQEREMWRIAQEALTNVERHAEAVQGSGRVALQRPSRRPRGARQRQGLPVRHGRTTRLLRDPRHAGACLEHRRHRRGGLRRPAEGPGFAASSNRGTDMTTPMAARNGRPARPRRTAARPSG